MGVPHETINKENIILQRKEAIILGCSFGFIDQSSLEKINVSSEEVVGKDGLEVISSLSPVSIRDKAGTFIGARMVKYQKKLKCAILREAPKSFSQSVTAVTGCAAFKQLWKRGK